MQRFFLADLNTTNFTFVLTNEEMIHQLVKVLRVKIGEKIIFFDGEENYDYIFQIKQINKKDIVLDQIGRNEKKTEIDFELNLYQSIPNKLDKIEYIIQKGVEVGIRNFVFYRSERSQKLIISDNKIDRLNKIIIEAVEQSGRNYVPELVILDKFDFSVLKNDQNIIFHTFSHESTLLKELKLDFDKNINLFVGPEGGFSDLEMKDFKKIFGKKVHLGDRILRTETTGIVTSFFIIQNKEYAVQE
ncbi:MAG: RsmE family RNA methyltransferase [Candidatus Gracilibacteria bacterium]|nr:RsmE family RNA methyltransferase [Candidatus Gracilibacteria bacterium]